MARTKQTAHKSTGGRSQQVEQAVFQARTTGATGTSSSAGASTSTGFFNDWEWPGSNRMIWRRRNSSKKKKSWKRRNHWQFNLPDYNRFQRDLWDEDETVLAASQLIMDAMPDDDLDHEEQFGTLRGEIVGIQYYRGTVNNGEMVSLLREPQNRYDTNAVRIENVDKLQVGHIKRNLASALAPIMDNNWARVEGLVPYGATNTYSMPVDLSFWGRPDNRDKTILRLRQAGLFMRNTPSSNGAKSAENTSASGASRTCLSNVEVQNELDSLFSKDLVQGDKTNVVEPCQAISTKLFKHQKQALNWMIHKENRGDLPPFWKESNKQYYNSVVNFTTGTRPASIRGGILADDMGLGKTLEMIALILTNFVDRKPLARPVEGRIRNSKVEKEERLSMYRAASEASCSYSQPSRKPSKADIRFIDDGDAEAGKDALEDEASMSEGETDEENEESIPTSTKLMLQKEDPDFSPQVKVKHSLKTKVSSPNVRSRPRRSSTARKRYVDEYVSSEDEDTEEITDDNKEITIKTTVTTTVKSTGKTKDDSPASLAQASAAACTMPDLMGGKQRPGSTESCAIVVVESSGEAVQSSTRISTQTTAVPQLLVSGDLGVQVNVTGVTPTPTTCKALEQSTKATDEDPELPNMGHMLTAPFISKQTTEKKATDYDSPAEDSDPDLPSMSSMLTPTRPPKAYVVPQTSAVQELALQNVKKVERIQQSSLQTLQSCSNDASTVEIETCQSDSVVQCTPVENGIEPVEGVVESVAIDTAIGCSKVDLQNGMLVDMTDDSTPVKNCKHDHDYISPPSKIDLNCTDGDKNRCDDSTNATASSSETTTALEKQYTKAELENGVVSKVCVQQSTEVLGPRGVPVIAEVKAMSEVKVAKLPLQEVVTAVQETGRRGRPKRNAKRPSRYRDEDEENLQNNDAPEPPKKRSRRKSAKEKLETEATMQQPDQSLLSAKATQVLSNGLSYDQTTSSPAVTPLVTVTAAGVPSDQNMTISTTCNTVTNTKAGSGSHPSSQQKKPEASQAACLNATNYPKTETGEFTLKIKAEAVTCVKLTAQDGKENSSLTIKKENMEENEQIKEEKKMEISEKQENDPCSGSKEPMVLMPIVKSEHVPQSPGRLKFTKSSSPNSVKIEPGKSEIKKEKILISDDVNDGKVQEDTCVAVIDGPPLPTLQPEDKSARKLSFKSKPGSSVVEPIAMKIDFVTEWEGRSMASGPRATLIICPLSVMSNWLNQLEDHVDESVQLKVYTWYGSSRTHKAKELAEQDIVLTTYSTLSNDHKGKGVLRKVEWLRLVLDEGHTIRNPNTLQTKAVLELKSQRKWVLTGTPVQNSMKDLWSLVKFLDIKPFTERHWWHRAIERPLSNGCEKALKMVATLMNNISLRRTKTQEVDGKPLVELPDRKVYMEHVTLNEEERATYDTMQKEGKLIVSRWFRQGTLLHHYGQVLAILMRLRQICCHPHLVAKAARIAMESMNIVAEVSQLPPNSAEGTGEENNISQEGALTEQQRRALVESLLQVLASGSDEECAICLDPLKAAVITECVHVFCRACIEEVIRVDAPNATCPLCRRGISKEQLVEVPEESAQEEPDTLIQGPWQSSSKVDALMRNLLALRKEDSTIKSLVVSQFTSLLTLIETPLKEHGFKFARLDGTMTPKQRTAAMESFSDPTEGSPTIFLLSLKAGGVGLNLTAACRVFLLDPAWNPATEDQCFDRSHRLGQTRDVVITKFIVEDSVEERMLELQEKKRTLMMHAFGKKPSAEERRKIRINEIKTLLDL